KRELRKIAANFVTLILLVICLVFISGSHSIGSNLFARQSPQKTISYIPRRDQPIRLSKVQVTGRSLALKANSASKEDFEAGDDWMKGLVLTLKNTTDKNIVYTSVYLQFPETEATGPIISLPLQYGHLPEKPGAWDPNTVLRPGEEVELVV